ncbi:unnamed protein product [Orchesella dallaii]|uniref:Uncharacterized protein n=1 Tax=Orchesella dallaii TaxID=48710 RepID=A0ABP1Q831_9HEXA
MVMNRLHLVCLVSLQFILIIHLNLVNSVNGKKCPGKCISNITECKAKGGKIAGYCTNELACCDYTYKKIGSCGSKKSDLNTAIFRSPDYPDFSNGDIICQFDFELSPNAAGIIIEFLDVHMDGRGLTPHSSCESDMIFLKGFPNWTPPANCGNLSNYSAVVDLNSAATKGMKTLLIVAMMSSKKYRWNIKVSQSFVKLNDSSDDPEEDGELPDDSYEDEYFPEEGRASNSNMTHENEVVFLENTSTFDSDDMDMEISRISMLLKTDQIASLSQPNEDGFRNTDISQIEDLDTETYLVNGDDTEITTVPWQASLRQLLSPRHAKSLPLLKLKNCSLQEGIHFCGGTVISDRHILSAAHCFLMGQRPNTMQKLSSVKVVLGDSNLCDNVTEGVQEFRVDKLFYHYAYDDGAILNDMVVIRLDKKIKFTDRVKPIKMAELGMRFENQEATASGWGLTNLTSTEQRNSTPEQLQFSTKMFIGNRSFCAKEQRRLFPTISSKSIVALPKYAQIFSSLLCTYVRDGKKPIVVGQV